jgi:hypothetical protein
MRSFLSLIFVSIATLAVLAGEQLAADAGSGQRVEKRKIELKRGKLSKVDEVALRKLVYSGQFATFVPHEGKWAECECVAVPKDVIAIYNRNEFGATDLLISIVEGGRPSDAKLAAAWAGSLLESPVLGAIIGTCDLSSFDEIDPVTARTHRDSCLDSIRTLTERKKQSN